ncbi:hypothetical protein [Synechococcus elongatus]|uniref:Uncharacterized protein n=1 Tax=Synechococcus elongatus PCC 11801 TaxID=2219813 RepID=A0AAN1QMU9_SYNEL|nr:hypothetical protein [Synechococcus elongatus]AZB72273.1 hypothetical protein DOP62_05635 [Synechococcus elongatus PCC 11801]
MIGLIILTIGAALVARSQVDQVTAISQRSTAQGEAAAEAGLALYQNLITNNRAIAAYCSETTTVGDGCQGTTAWTNANSWNRTTTGIGICNTDATPLGIQNAAARTDWTNIDANDLAKGQYRFIEYTLPNANRTTGRLTVEGRSANDAQRAGVTRLRAEISIRAGGGSPVPALWLRLNGGVTPVLSSNRFNGNIRLNTTTPCTIPNWVTTSNLSNPATQSIVTEPQSGFPDTPTTFPSGTGYYDLSSNSQTNSNSTRANSDARIWGTSATNNPSITFPRSGDVAAADGRYHYLIDRLVNPGNRIIRISDNTEVVFYVRSEINITGTVRINCAGTGTACTVPTSGSPGRLTIYGNVNGRYGTCLTGTISVSGNPVAPCDGASLTNRQNTNQIRISSTSQIRALILAPNATASITGNNSDTGFVTGGMWVNSWNTSGAITGNKIMVNSEGSYGDYLNNASAFDSPAISPVRSWTRLQVP